MNAQSMRIEKIVLACTNSAGDPDFVFVKVQCSESDHAKGTYFRLAKLWAVENGYEGPFHLWDSSGCPDWLSDRFVWDSASIVDSTPADFARATIADLDSAGRPCRPR